VESAPRAYRLKASNAAPPNPTFAGAIPRSLGERRLTNSGIASVYSDHNTASGEQMNSAAMTAAHRTLPFGTRVTVVNRNNGRSAVVRINDVVHSYTEG
jgi:rare lipoprotein A (peptidoglycan hydrolase)